MEFANLEMTPAAARPLDVWDKDVEVEKSSYLWTKTPVYLERRTPLQKNCLNVLELFCGCGGTSCGFEMAGYQTVLGVDVLEPAIATFHENHGTAGAFLGDIRKVSADEIVRHIGPPVDVVIAGIPCQALYENKVNTFTIHGSAVLVYCSAWE